MAHTTYSQLSLEERDRIAAFRAQGHSLGEMATRLQRNKSTISRELRRNGGTVYWSYGAGTADRRARQRKYLAARRPRLKDAQIRTYVHRKLRQGWSPEIIAGRLPMTHPELSISPEAIYQYVYQPEIRRQENLIPCLVRAHRQRQLTGHRHTHREPHIPGRISIRQRPAGVHTRTQFGHWESDGVQSRRCLSSLHVMVERKTRFTKISKLPRRSARHTRNAITRTLSRYPRCARLSITYDNGSENVEHREVNRVLNTKSFFCEPFHSWEKGTVENTIGLVRRDYPKKTNFDIVSSRDVKRLEHKLNNRPRKVLQFKTPKEAFNHSVALAH